MRMWMLPTGMLCNQHLLGEHGELHKHRHNFVKQHKISGRLNPVVQIEPMFMRLRHDALAAEMTKRGMNHKSPYKQHDLSYLEPYEQYARVDKAKSIQDLKARCSSCSERIKDFSKKL